MTTTTAADPTDPAAPADRPHAVLCDVDGVIRSYDMTEVTRLERAAGLPEGATAAVGYAPENDLPLLLGRITHEEWEESIVRGLLPQVDRSRGRWPTPSSAPTPGWTRPWSHCCAGPAAAARWCWSPTRPSGWTRTWPGSA
ncbi:hypothetical protein [Streptomyces sp. NPDC014894]|uniref:hypothetical protein n=1 Tax=Streptomyces sp. NPDC014894 TaxID=3364931 RepID=UPI0036F6C347